MSFKTGGFKSSKRRFVRSGRGGAGVRPSSLAGSAGGLSEVLAGADRASVEQLERRQMLFSLSVTPDTVDPATGIGQAVAYFGYVIPVLASNFQAQLNQPATPITEDFNDEPLANVASNQPLLGSGIRVRHNVIPGSDVAINAFPRIVDNPDRYLRLNLNNVGEFVDFKFYADADTSNTPVGVRSAAFDIGGDRGVGDNTGIYTDATKISLFLNGNRLNFNLAGRIVDGFTGADLRNLIAPGGIVGLGTGTFNVGPFGSAALGGAAAFDTMRIELVAAPGAGNSAFSFDNLSFTPAKGQWAGLLTPFIYGAAAVLSGPVGASVNFRDLYGRDMVRTLGLPAPQNSQVLLVDPNDDGIPDFNAGIGSITMSGTDERTSFKLWGGTIDATTTRPDNAEAFDGQFAFSLSDDLGGFFTQWEGAGFGFIYSVRTGNYQVAGLPPVGGTVVVGSPFIRDITSQTGFGLTVDANGQGRIAPANNTGFVTTGFTNPTQGVFIDDGGSIGSVTIHGMLLGSSHFSGAVGQLNVGYILGSVSVNGDLGQVVSQTDAGLWVIDPSFQVIGVPTDLGSTFRSGSQLIVGRTLGSVSVAGRSLMDVTVIGDLTSPATRPPLQNTTYSEREYVFQLAPTAPKLDGVRQQLYTRSVALDVLSPFGLAFGSRDIGGYSPAPVAFGDTWSRNDSILSAEWIGGVTSSVRLVGDVSGIDPWNTGEDKVDVYAFAVDGLSDVVIDSPTVSASRSAGAYMRVVDENGRVVASPALPREPLSKDVRQALTTIGMRFRPTAPGVLYLVVGDSRTNDTDTTHVPYVINVTGMATATLGAFRTGGGLGIVDSAITVLSGNVGSLRVGTGYVGADGQETGPASIYNTTESLDDSLSFKNATITVEGNFYDITTGGDIGWPATQGRFNTNDIVFNIGGDFGSLHTGMLGLLGTGNVNGDVNYMSLFVGGSIGLLDVHGGIGADQDDPTRRVRLDNSRFLVRSGRDSRLKGDIGEIRVGFHVYNDALQIVTPAGSTVGAVLISQDSYGETGVDTGLWQGTRGLPFTTGPGTNVKFVDFPSATLLSPTLDSFFPIFGSTPIRLIDDGGAEVIIEIPDAPTTALLGSIRYLPIDGSQGGAIANITVNLDASQGGAAAGWTLRVRSASTASTAAPGAGTTPVKTGTVGIGRIVVTGATAGSNIDLGGTVEIDVLRIEQTGGAGMGLISNLTPDGDIVSADVVGVDTVEVGGDLGRTELPSWGPKRLGHYVGVATTLSATVGDLIGFPGAALGRTSNGNVIRALNDDNYNPGNGFLDDEGSVLDGYVNGIIVRDGNVTEIRANGAVGDVVLQGAASTLQSVVANVDRRTTAGKFDGVIGHIYALNIGNIDIGQGQPDAGPSPYAAAAIAAGNSINSIRSSTPGATLRGVVVASQLSVASTPADQAPGINSIELDGGGIFNAFIGVSDIDAFWVSVPFDDLRATRSGNILTPGEIRNLQVRNANVYGSFLLVDHLSNLEVSNGFIDASVVEVHGNLDVINAQGVRNSTLTGQASELRHSEIKVGRNADRILVGAGGLTDTTISVVGSVTTLVSAPFVTRSSLNVANVLQSFQVTGEVKSSSLTAGLVQAFTVNSNIVASTIAISGKQPSITVLGQVVSSAFNITGPDGELGSLTVSGGFSGSVAVTGPIGSIAVLGGDLRGSITTTTARGDVGSIAASGDVAITSDISGKVNSITAGKNIGDSVVKGSVVVRGNVSSVSAPNGQLYADLRVGGTLGSVVLGSAIAKPGNNLVGKGSIFASGRIENVVVNGDLGGSIISYSGGIGSVAVNEGSVLPGTTIAAYAGDLTSLVINNGNLYGNIRADYDLVLLRVLGRDGVFGDVGVSPLRSASIAYDARRNQLPPGVGPDSKVNGVRVSAGHDIVTIDVPTGFVFESQFRAGRTIGTVTIAGTIGNDGITPGRASWFAAGDSINNIVAGGIFDTNFYAGLIDLGTDDAPGGTGTAADTVRQGVIRSVNAIGGAFNDALYAGIAAGANGLYGDLDDRVVLGSSLVDQVKLGGSASNVTVLADNVSASVASNPSIIKPARPTPANAQTDSGVGTPGAAFSGTASFAAGASTITITVSGPGQAFFQFAPSDLSTATPRLTLRGSTAATAVTVSSSTGTLTNFDIVTNNEASVGAITFLSDLAGDSDIVIDANLGTLNARNVTGTGSILVGGGITSASFVTLAGGFIDALSADAITIAGDFGAANPDVTGEARIDLVRAGALSVGGASRGLVSIDRDAGSIAIGGLAERTQIRVGGALGSLSAGALSRSIVAAGERVGPVTSAGAMFDSALLAGVDLGTDALLGGAGRAADVLTAGSIASVVVGGNFGESDIIAGFLRGVDGYFGTVDDTVASGRSTIGSVTIGGTQVGSSRGSESYRIASSGTVGTVTVGGSAVTGATGNFAVLGSAQAPDALRVVDLRSDIVSSQYIAQIVFNQSIDFSTVSKALNIFEVRGTGGVLIRLIEGSDYTILPYDDATRTVTVQFSRALTSANLPQRVGVPGPGVYRFTLDQSIIRAKQSGVRLDGDGDGLVAANDNYAENTIIGDAGDRLVAVTANPPRARGGGTYRVDLYAPTNLDVLLDNTHTPDGLADTNKAFTIRGSIGDHPDNDADNFRISGDTDIFQITLQAGQILRLSDLTGSAVLAGLALINPDGVQIGDNRGGVYNTPASNASVSYLAARSTEVGDSLANQATNFLVLRTGVYRIIVGTTTNYNNLGGAAVVTNPEFLTPGATGKYAFTLQVFDDGDSGFSASTDAGDGTRLIDSPLPIAFAGSDGIFGTADDRATIRIGVSTFTWSAGLDGLPNTADDVVSGGNGIQSSVRVGNGPVTTTIKAAIGSPAYAGVPSVITPDADIFHLNNRQPIAPNTRIRVTVRLQDLGADLGSPDPIEARDQRGSVQFGLFDTTDSVSVNDALLVFSPTDFLPYAGEANKTIADNGQTKYGFDAKGDFYVEFLAPEHLGTSSTPATFAAYVQGLYNTDYTLEVVTGGTGERVKITQNILLETNGGTLNWLRVDGQPVQIGAWNSRTLGFAGTVPGDSLGRDFSTYILANLTTSLNQLFRGLFPTDAQTDLAVRFSTNPGDFEFQPFSTVYLASSADEVSTIDLFGNGLSFNPFSVFRGSQSIQPFGYSQHSDPLNADLRDEAVVFVPSLLTQTLGGVAREADAVVSSLTAAVARRAGELMGLRITQDNSLATNVVGAANALDPMAANSPLVTRTTTTRVPTLTPFALSSVSNRLSLTQDSIERSDFFLGRQNAAALLDRVLLRR